MDFKRLDKIIENSIIKNKLFIETLPEVIEYSKKIYQEHIINTNDAWSKQIKINDSINIVYQFLKTIDNQLAQQFLTIISLKDKNNTPYVNILPKKQYPKGRNEVTIDGRVHIYYENTPNDPFNILHEMLHKMNECNTINENREQIETYLRNYFGETVSILGEMMLGKYMVENKIITENDFYIRKRFRLNDSKEAARDIIIENELIKMKLQGKKINYKNLIDQIKNYNQNSIEYEIINDEKKDLRRIKNIFKNNKLNFKTSQKYVIAQVLSEELIKRDTVVEDFIKLHYAVGDVNSKIDTVYNEIILKKKKSK